MDSNVTPKMIAAIDIGTNTVLLLIGEVFNNNVNVIREEYRIPRLGRGVDASKNLHQDSIQRVIAVLKEFRNIIKTEYADCKHIIITATSAVRDALNKEYFLDLVKKEVGIEVELLSGNTEAIYTYNGAIAPLSLSSESKNIVLDIGGGSTEIAVGYGSNLKHYTSIDMGSVRFTERFLNNDPPTSGQIKACRDEIKRMLHAQTVSVQKPIKAIGVAGTVTSLAAMETEQDSYRPDQFNGYVLSLSTIKKYIHTFSSNNIEYLTSVSPKVLSGRVDIFLAGLLILEGFLEFNKLTEIIVSTGGIRHGSIIKSEKI